MAKSISEFSNSVSKSTRKSSKSRTRSKLTNANENERNFWYQPHYITGLVALIGYLFYLAFFQISMTQSANFK